MQKIKLFMVLALLVAGVSGAWAAPVSFSYSDFTGQGSSQTYTPISASKDGVTVSSDRGYGPSGNNHFRIYAGGKLSITSSKKITSVYVRFSGSSYTNLSGDNFSKDYSYSAGSYGIWTGLSNSVELTNSTNSQARITYIYVSFEGSVLYTWSSSPEGIEGDLEVISSPISYSFNNTNYESDITGPRDFGGDIGKAISVTNVPSIIVLQNGTPYDFPYYSYNYFYGSASSITPAPITSSNVNTYLKAKDLANRYTAQVTAVEHAGNYVDVHNIIVTYTPLTHQMYYTVQYNADAPAQKNFTQKNTTLT